MPKVSIIMPSLNVVKYIEQCMESVINQTLKDIEIIAVDAGSTDGTLEILRKYELHDNRVQIIHSDKKSYGYQVNLGISRANGDYIGIVETDDYIDLKMYETLYNLSVELKADYVKGGAVRFLGLTGGGKYCRKIEAFSGKEFAQNYGVITVNPSITPELILKDYYLWTGIYRNDFVKSILLNETPGAAYQDIGFLIQTFCKAKKALYVDKIFYYYRQDNPSASGYNPKAFRFLVEEYKYVESLLRSKEQIWHTLSYCKMFRQTNHRIKLMAISGSLWDSALADLNVISNKLKETISKNQIAAANLETKEWSELELMLQSPKYLYNYYKTVETNRYNELLDLLNNLLSTDQIVVFGCGLLGNFVLALFDLNGIDKIEAYCDNNSDLWGKDLQGKPIISPIQAVQNYPNATYIVANRAHCQEIKNQLVGMGISDNNIYEYTLGADPILLNKIFLNS
ncbi:glycosyltransferase family 2 protein [Clostridium thermarum]|uniref:glycosyltransferase family 2 protein n=1 Tax=Clostridium thermarum TaxID=1716543 RepID=UPI0013D75AD8|nr:glycosyltransferase [Clostridium thermarum]